MKESTDSGMPVPPDAVGRRREMTVVRPDVRTIGTDPRDLIGTLELPLVLIDLNDLTVAAISWAALKYLGTAPSAVVGLSVENVVIDQDRADALRALTAMRDGAMDSYRTHRRLGTPAGPGRAVTGWVRSFRFGDRRIALAEEADESDSQLSPLAAYLGREPLTMVVGTTDARWVITSVSSEVSELLGITAAEATGRRFLCSFRQSDVRRLLTAGRRANGHESVALRLRLRDASGESAGVCCVLTALAGSKELLFILMREDELMAGADANRVTKLEENLRRIAAEVEASGVDVNITALAQPIRLGHFGGLTDRQSEVLAHLVRGERVATIAKALFVSQSTIRNHLAAIFEHFAVHSQAELLAKLAAEPIDDSCHETQCGA